MIVSRASVARTVTSALLVASSHCFSTAAVTNTNTNTNNNSAMMQVEIPPENLAAISNLEPAALWSQFATLSSIPRPSKQEDAVIDYIKAFAKERGLTWKQDAVGNIVVFRPGSGNGKNAPAVVLQGHVDMVTEKNSDTVHDFEKDPILLRRFEKNDGAENWLGAKGTTLGADNGIGVAAALALLDAPETETLPPLEALFTIDEETGLTGAIELDAKALGLTGKTMLNLDTEEWGELYVGCAGGGDSTITLPFTRNAVDSATTFVEVRVEGLMGGHSGINIHEGRANAVLLCASTAQAALKSASDVSLVSITGGDKHNAIPREARAVFAVSGPDGVAAVEKTVQECANAAKAEFGDLETNLVITTVKDVEKPSVDPIDNTSANKLLSMMLALPHGPLKFSHSIPDLVETSNNVASVALSEDSSTATVLCSSRSSIGTALDSARNKIASIASLAGANIEMSPSYPGWNPDMNSQVLGMAKGLLSQKLGGSTPGIKAIHAGLECGLLIEKMGGDVDALSFGPTIIGAHSPDESILIDTVPPFFDLVKDILTELCKETK